MTVVASAQDREIRSRTEIKTDDASVVSMTGCLKRDVVGNYTLFGTAVKGKEGLTTETKVRTENDRDESRVTTTERTRVEDGRIGTAGTLSTFLLRPRDGVSLSQHVGQQVQISAVMVDPDRKDAEVRIEEKSSVDREGADNRTKRSRTEIELEGGGVVGHYTVMTVKGLGSKCS
jgi:hypothetical protein